MPTKIYEKPRKHAGGRPPKVRRCGGCDEPLLEGTTPRTRYHPACRPSRQPTSGKFCACCGDPLVTSSLSRPRRDLTFCSDACRQKNLRRKNGARATEIYEEALPFRLTPAGTPPNTCRMEQFLKLLGITGVAYRQWAGSQPLSVFAAENPAFTQRAWEILILENTDNLTDTAQGIGRFDG